MNKNQEKAIEELIHEYQHKIDNSLRWAEKYPEAALHYHDKHRYMRMYYNHFIKHLETIALLRDNNGHDDISAIKSNEACEVELCYHPANYKVKSGNKTWCTKCDKVIHGE